MATAKIDHLADLASNVIRPALDEAKLITEKRAGDAVYVATLTEELRNIEAKIAAMEEAAQLCASAAAVQFGLAGASEDLPDAKWIRAKSGELERRLRHIEQSSKQR